MIGRLATVLLVFLAACRSAATGSVPKVAPPAPVPERYWPAFEALAAAVEAHEDEVARGILGGLSARLAAEREPSPAEAPGIARALSIVDGYPRILRGRGLVAGIDLELHAVEAAESSSVRVFLRASSRHDRELLMRPGPSTLRIQQTSLGPLGAEMHSAWTRHVAGLEEFIVAKEGSVDVPLGSFPLAVPGDSLATRMRWDLVLRSGEIETGEGACPAAGIVVSGVQVERLAAVLPTAPVEPSELARYASGGTPWLPALLERALRVAPERRGEALDLLAPLVETSTPAQLERLAPALRWLSGESDPVAGHLGWKSWFRDRALPPEPESASGLDIR